MGCISKFTLFLLNFAVFVVGVAVVALASIIINKDSKYGVLLTESGIFTLPIIVLIVGLCILILGFLGCCGAMQENSCMLKTYAGIVTVLLLAEIVLGILVFIYPNKAEEIIKNSMEKSFDKYGGEDEALTKSLDEVQQELKCCGVDGYKDWDNFTAGGNNNVSVGCCKDETDIRCNENVTNLDPDKAEEKIYTRGCYDALKEQVQGLAIGLGAILLILAVVMVVSITCACGLANKSASYA